MATTQVPCAVERRVPRPTPGRKRSDQSGTATGWERAHHDRLSPDAGGVGICPVREGRDGLGAWRVGACCSCCRDVHDVASVEDPVEKRGGHDMWSCPAMSDTFSFGPTGEVNHGGEQRALSARVQGADGRTGGERAQRAVAGARVRAVRADDPQLGQARGPDEGRCSDGLTTEARLEVRRPKR